MASEESVIEEETEESRRPRIAKRLQMPTKAEYDSHMTLHADYRDWCPDCVAGRGISHQHRASKNERTGREFSLDYAFMTAEDIGEDMCTIHMESGHLQSRPREPHGQQCNGSRGRSTRLDAREPL